MAYPREEIIKFAQLTAVELAEAVHELVGDHPSPEDLDRWRNGFVRASDAVERVSLKETRVAAALGRYAVLMTEIRKHIEAEAD